jgi:hypothetical protein
LAQRKREERSGIARPSFQQPSLALPESRKTV